MKKPEVGQIIQLKSDGNKYLVIDTPQSHPDTALLRAYTKYVQQSPDKNFVWCSCLVSGTEDGPIGHPFPLDVDAYSYTVIRRAHCITPSEQDIATAPDETELRQRRDQQLKKLLGF